MGSQCETADARQPGRPRKVRGEAPQSPGADSSGYQLFEAIASSRFSLDKALQPQLGTQTPSGSGGFETSSISGLWDDSFNPIDSGQPLGSFGLETHVNPNTIALDTGPGLQKSMLPKFDLHQCLHDLSDLNMEMHDQLRHTREKGASLTLGFYICPSDLTKTGESIVESTMTMSQRFHLIIANIESLARREQELASGRSLRTWDDNAVSVDDFLLEMGNAAEGNSNDSQSDRDHGALDIDTPTVLLIISCYVQLITIFEGMFVHLHRKLKSLDTEPIPPLDTNMGVTMGAFYESKQILTNLQRYICCAVRVSAFSLHLLPTVKL